MFVQPGQKKNLLTEAAARAHDDVRDDFFIGMAEMRLPVHVVNRSRDVKHLAHPATVWPRKRALAMTRMMKPRKQGGSFLACFTEENLWHRPKRREARSGGLHQPCSSPAAPDGVRSEWYRRCKRAAYAASGAPRPRLSRSTESPGSIRD